MDNREDLARELQEARTRLVEQLERVGALESQVEEQEAEIASQAATIEGLESDNLELVGQVADAEEDLQKAQAIITSRQSVKSLHKSSAANTPPDGMAKKK